MVGESLGPGYKTSLYLSCRQLVSQFGPQDSMKFLVILSALVAAAFAKPGLYPTLAGPIAPGLRYIGAPAYSAAPLAYSAAPLAYSAAPLAYSAASYSAAPLAYSAPVVAAAPAVAAAPVVAAAPAIAPAPIAYSAAPVVAAAPVAVAAPAVKSQYHAQDELGNAAFGHSEPGQVHSSVQDAAGNRVGSFSYLNPTDGQIHRTDYVADSLGYRVAANDLPVAPAGPIADTPEVVAARAAHLSLHRARRSVLLQTPAATTPLATPVAVAAPSIAAPLAYSAPIAAPLAYSAPVASHLAYSAPIASPLAYSAVPAGIPATLTTIVNNPGHAVSYRID